MPSRYKLGDGFTRPQNNSISMLYLRNVWNKDENTISERSDTIFVYLSSRRNQVAIKKQLPDTPTEIFQKASNFQRNENLCTIKILF